jgi:hypothetical protein
VISSSSGPGGRELTSSDSADRVASWRRAECPLHSGQGPQLCWRRRERILKAGDRPAAGVDPDYVDRLVELGILTPVEARGSPSSGGWTCHRRGGLGVASCKLSRVTVNRAAVPAAWPTDGCSLPSSLTPKS